MDANLPEVAQLCEDVSMRVENVPTSVKNVCMSQDFMNMLHKCTKTGGKGETKGKLHTIDASVATR